MDNLIFCYLLYMTIHPILIVGAQPLHTPVRPVDIYDASLRQLAADMYETMYASDGLGLAANQIGADASIFVYDSPDAEGAWHAGVVVNPQVRTSALPIDEPDREADVEGCLSVPGEIFPTRRASWAILTGFDLEGKPIEVPASGVLARCFQHEADHLSGLLYLDRLCGGDAVAAREMVVTRGWGVPGGSWLPETPAPGQGGREAVGPSGRRRGPLATKPARIPAGQLISTT